MLHGIPLGCFPCSSEDLCEMSCVSRIMFMSTSGDTDSFSTSVPNDYMGLFPDSWFQPSKRWRFLRLFVCMHSLEVQQAPEKLPSQKERVVFQPSFFRGYVKFWGCIILYRLQTVNIMMRHHVYPRISQYDIIRSQVLDFIVYFGWVSHRIWGLWIVCKVRMWITTS